MASRFEMLEQRLFLEGNVNVTLTNGMLRITGDNSENTITIATVADGTMTFTPDATTTINDAVGVFALSAADVNTITKIKANMKLGDDSITMAVTDHAIDTLQKADFGMGGGANNLNIVDLDATRNMNLKMGKLGANTITTAGVDVGGNFSVKGGSEVDTINIGTTNATKKMNINGGLGADVITLTTITADKTKVTGSEDATVHVNGVTAVGANISVKGATIDNAAPTVTNAAAMATLEILNSAANGSTVKLDGGVDSASVLGADADGNTVTYEITAGDDDGIFAVNETTGALTLANAAELGDAGTIYNVTVTVSDWNGSLNQAVVITVT